jgi:hypothetical protein
VPPHQSFRHEALLYHDHDEYLDTVVPFLREGVERGEHVLVAAAEPARHQIRERLGHAATEVAFVDMSELGANPARIMPALTALVESHHHDGRAMRVLGQPAWAGRREVEIAESRLHEGLVNLVIPPDAPLWLICPYDASTDDPAVTEHAAHSHPVLLEKGDYRGSTAYAGAWYVEQVFSRPLPAAPDDAEVRTFRRADIGEVANRVLATAFRAGISAEKSHQLSAAMRELASDATVGDTAVLRLWTDDDAVICEIEDLMVAAPVVGRIPTSTRAARKGLWLANQTSDLIQVRSGATGTTVRVYTWR